MDLLDLDMLVLNDIETMNLLIENDLIIIL
jgi:hypothetical protein